MTVEIDESKFGKTKFNRGRYIEGQWVFGGICLKVCDTQKKKGRNEELFKANKSQRSAIVSTIVQLNKELYA